MFTRKEAISFCLTFEDAYEDYPFHDPNWTVMRHRSNQKAFALIFGHSGQLWINVKVDPFTGEFWRKVFPSVVPAYHMNKEHWIGIILDGKMKDEEIGALISDSFRLTSPKKKTK